MRSALGASIFRALRREKLKWQNYRTPISGHLLLAAIANEANLIRMEYESPFQGASRRDLYGPIGLCLPAHPRISDPKEVKPKMKSIPLAPSIPFRKWLIVSQYYHPEPGAPQIRLGALTKELRRRGCEVEVLTALPNYPVGKIHPDYQGRCFQTEMIDGVRVHRQWLYPAAGRRSLSRLLCYGTFSLGALMRAPLLSKPDVVFIEAQPITVALAGLLCKLLRGVPFIYNTPDLQVEIAGEASWLSMSSLVKAAGHLEGFLMKRAFCVSTVTDAFVEHFSAARNIPKSHITF